VAQGDATLAPSKTTSSLVISTSMIVASLYRWRPTPTSEPISRRPERRYSTNAARSSTGRISTTDIESSSSRV